ncbi:MAG: cyanophycin synthetase [Rhodothermales bacterium]|jgi:cyanophycin synthetase
MIEIKELRAIRGPNRYKLTPVIFMVLDIKEYELKPSDKIDGFSDRLVKQIPSLSEHGCSIGSPGGFIQRLQTGTWAGHIIEHLALELQCLAGMEVSYGKTFTSSIDGVYYLAFSYLVESAGVQAAKDAVTLYEAVAEGRTFDVNEAVSKLRVLREEDMLGPTTWSIVKEAKSRGIPFIRLNKDSYIQLGHGANQKRIQASMTCQTSAIAMEIADEKMTTKEILKESGIPVPTGRVVSTEEEAISVFTEVEAVVVKPNVGNHGHGITINVTDVEHLKVAFEAAQAKHPDVVIEEYVQGADFRLLVIGGKLVAAAKREPAMVVGDGKTSIGNLIYTANLDPRRGFGHEKALTRIDVDHMTDRLLSQSELSLESCPAVGEKVYLKATANLSQGGTATDVTNEVSPDIRLMAERVARIIGLDCMGIDVLATDISLSLEESGIRVVEVNAAPGFRMHLEPTSGQPRQVAEPLVDMLFPEGYVQTPIIAVTGTNGKTTTCKLITHALKYSGRNVGLACTTGIEIDGAAIINGDYSGPEGAEIVVKEPTVDHIVLEVARGGLVRRGLGVDAVDVGVLLNVGSDHIGTDWIETQRDLFLAKSTVVEVVKKTGTSVLNADDPLISEFLVRAAGTIILFSLDSNNPSLIKHIEEGGTVITVESRNAIIRSRELDIIVCGVEEIPITFGGVVDFNIANALAAIGALHGLKLPLVQIQNGVLTFYPSPNQNPGRMNLLDFRNYKVLVDFGHNLEAAQALAKLLPRISKGRKIALCHGTGSRTDEQIMEFGEALASVYDHIILTEFAPRNRPHGETLALVHQGLLKGGFNQNSIEIVSKPDKAVDYLFSKVETGDLLVIHPDELEPIMSQVMERYRKIISQS